MKTLRRLSFALVLTAMFAVPTLADGGITQAPGAPAPGQTDTPPSMASGETQGPGFAVNGIIHTPGIAAIVLDLEGMFF